MAHIPHAVDTPRGHARIGFVGLGGMGSILAKRLLDAGYPTTVTNRTAARGAHLVESGARWASSPAELASGVDIVLSMVSDDKALDTVALGQDGILAGARAGTVYADLSTVSPSASTAVASAAAAASVEFVRAPVTGSTVLAAQGQLRVMCSGHEDAIRACEGPFSAFATRVFQVGGGEQARVMKLVLNSLLATTMTGFAEALVVGSRAGLDWQTMLDVFCDSAVASPLVKYKAASLATRDFDPAFTPRLLAKDLRLALNEAREHGAVAPLTALTEQLLEATAGLGFGEQDVSATVLLYEALAGGEPATTEASRS